jgi:hypothetical protein
MSTTRKRSETKGKIPMTVIALKSPLDVNLSPLVAMALDREKSILRHSILASRKRVKLLAAKFKVDPAQLLAGGVPHSEEQDMDLIELEGELAILGRHEEQLKGLESLELCA